MFVILWDHLVLRVGGRWSVVSYRWSVDGGWRLTIGADACGRCGRSRANAGSFDSVPAKSAGTSLRMTRIQFCCVNQKFVNANCSASERARRHNGTRGGACAIRALTGIDVEANDGVDLDGGVAAQNWAEAPVLQHGDELAEGAGSAVL